MSNSWSKEANICDEYILSIYEDYSVNVVAELLLPTGLLIDKSTLYTGSFEKYVFFYGNNDEVYSKQEIDFISAIEDMAIFTEFYKRTKRGLIPCRVIAARNPHFDTLDFSIAFTKIINKASDGFNICVSFSDEGIILSCRSYDFSKNTNYYISDLISRKEQIEELCNKLIFSSDYESFVDYYAYLRDCIRYQEELHEIFSVKRNERKTPRAFIEVLMEIEADTGLSLSKEIERFLSSLEEEHQVTFADKVAEADEYLFTIESSRVNTMEILFEAEEMERMAYETEQNNERILKQEAQNNDLSEMDPEMKALLKDPESVIKLLKKKRGI